MAQASLAMPDTRVHEPTLSSFSRHDAALVRSEALASEQAGILSAPVQELVHARDWLRMLAPKAVGGGELPLPQAVRLEEAIAAADGSTGWTVTLCAGAGWFAGFLPPAFAREVMSTPGLCLGGSGAPTGYADIEGGGYRLTGSWDFATGAPMTTHFTMNAVLREHGQPLLDQQGAQRMRAFILPAGAVTVHENWHTIGLKATASHSFSVDRAWVGPDHAFDLTPGGATANGPLYRFPFLSLAFVTLAANLSGMATNFIVLARDLIARRRHHVTRQPLAELPQVARALEHGPAKLEHVRARFYDQLDRMWDMVCRHQPVPEADTHALHATSLEMVEAARRAVDELYPLCGLCAADERSEIGRIWRDLHTATQHALMLPAIGTHS
jgi:alkylation response protein AidB-like acyl-CoA dehydrogenase